MGGAWGLGSLGAWALYCNLKFEKFEIDLIDGVEVKYGVI